MRNPVKKWWFDHEIVDGVTVEARGTNHRDISPDKTVDKVGQKIAYYHANMMPPPDQPQPMPVNRKSALAAKEFLETPTEARERVSRGGPTPEHYIPTPPAGSGVIDDRNPNPFDEEQ